MNAAKPERTVEYAWIVSAVPDRDVPEIDLFAVVLHSKYPVVARRKKQIGNGMRYRQFGHTLFEKGRQQFNKALLMLFACFSELLQLPFGLSAASERDYLVAGQELVAGKIFREIVSERPGKAVHLGGNRTGHRRSRVFQQAFDIPVRVKRS